MIAVLGLSLKSDIKSEYFQFIQLEIDNIF